MYSILPRCACVSLVHLWVFDDFDDFTTLRFDYCTCSHCDRFERRLIASSKKKRHFPSCVQTVHTVHTTSYALLAAHYSYINITVLKAKDPSLLFFQSSRAVVQSPSPVSLPAHSPTRPSAASHPQSLTRSPSQSAQNLDPLFVSIGNGKDLGHKPPTLTTLTSLSHLESRKGTGNIKLLSHSQHQQPVTGTYRYRRAIHSPKYCSTPLSLSAAAKRLTLHAIKKYNIHRYLHFTTKHNPRAIPRDIFQTSNAKRGDHQLTRLVSVEKRKKKILTLERRRYR